MTIMTAFHCSDHLLHLRSSWFNLNSCRDHRMVRAGISEPRDSDGQIFECKRW